MKKLILGFVAACAAVGGFVAQATTLVYEGFDKSDYGIGDDANATTLSSPKVKGENNVGFTANTQWAGMGGTQPKVFGTLLALDYPQAMKDRGFTAIGGSCGMNPGANDVQMRAMNHSFAANTLKVSEGTLAVSMLVNADEAALGKLSAKTSVSGGSYYGFGVCKTPSGNTYSLLTSNPSSIGFVIWKNSSNVYKLAALFTSTAGAVSAYDICDYETGKTYVCYAELKVGAGTDGAEVIRAGAAPTDSYDDTNIVWTKLDGETETVELDVISDTSYPSCMGVCGPYGTNKGYFRGDELRIATELAEVIAITTTEPRLTKDDATVVWNTATEQFEASAKMLKNSATLQAAARLSDDDPLPVLSTVSDTVAEGASGSVSFSGLTANRTYDVSITATNASGSDTKGAGTLYAGDLSLTLVQNAHELNLTPGVVTIARAVADPYDLSVYYTFSSTAEGAGAGTTWEADDGVVIIPAGETSATITLQPLVDGTIDEDITVILTLAAGGYRNVGATQDIVLGNVTYNTWRPGEVSDKLASNPDNWLLGRVPLERDDILLDATSGDLIWDENAPHAVRSWTQSSAYTGTVTVNTVFPGKGDFTCLTITGACVIDGGTMTHPQSRTMGDKHAADWDWLGDLMENETYRLRLVCGSLSVGADGKIDVATKGYYASHNDARVYAAHGGQTRLSSPVYDNPKEPIHIGLPHRTTSNYWNGKGGGAIYLTVNGAAVVNGTISADAGNSGFGAGAAGSVYLNATSVSGTGRISAYGSATGEGNYKGTGGRVAIITQTPVDRTTFAAITAASEWKNSSNKVATEYGGAGTVYFKDATRSNGILVVAEKEDKCEFVPSHYSRYTAVGTDGDWTFDALELGARSFLMVPTGMTLTLPNGLNSVRGLATTEGSVGGIVTMGGGLDLGTATVQEMNSRWMLTGWSNVVLNCSLTVRDGAMIGVPRQYEQVNDGSKTGLAALPTCSVRVTGDLTIAADGKVSAVHCGYRKPSQWVEQGLLGHAAHGGRLNAAKSHSITTYGSYDSMFAPALPGCSIPWPNGQGCGFSGGAVALVVDGALALNGSVNANGEPESYNGGGNAGGGAGGSVDITAGTIAGSGSISANGGFYAWMSGPGGRIAVKLTTAGASFANYTGSLSASGRNGTDKGSAGTIYLKTGDEAALAGTVKIAMTGDGCQASNSNTTEMVSLGYAGNAVADLKKVKFEVSSYSRAAVNADLRVASLTLADATAAVDFEGHTLTVGKATINGVKVPSGTYTIPAKTDAGVGVHATYGALYNTATTPGTLVVKGVGMAIIVR